MDASKSYGRCGLKGAEIVGRWEEGKEGVDGVRSEKWFGEL
jgi:hypothetical protein